MERASAREIRLRPEQVHADMGLGLVGAAQPRHADLVLPVVVIGAVVVHHDQHRDLVLGGDPERAGVEHQVAVGLDVDHDALRVAVRERHAERNADLGRGAELDAGMPVRLVEVPELAHLLLEVVGGEHPILVLDDLPDLQRQPREGQRRGIPVLARVLLPFRPDLRRGACRSRPCGRRCAFAAWDRRRCARGKAASAPECRCVVSPSARTEQGCIRQ